MGTATSLGLGIGILLIFINVASSAITVDNIALEAFKDVDNGKQRYAIFVLGKNLNTLEHEKSSTNEFKSLADDLKKARQAGQPKYAVFSMDVKGSNDKKLIFIVWIPMSTSVILQKAYKEESDDVMEAFNFDPWVTLFSGSLSDLDLEMIRESASAGYNIIESAENFYYLQETVEIKQTVTVESTVITEYTKVTKGSNSYIILVISPDFKTISFEKIGEPGAGFDDLIAYLKSSTKAKFACLPTVGKDRTKSMMLIEWIPVAVSDADRVKIGALVPKLKEALKSDFNFEFPVSSATDLNIKAISNIVKGGKDNTPSKEVQVSLDNGAKSAAGDISKELIRYATFKFSDDLSNLMVDKVATLKADFNAFIDDLVQTQNDKEPRFAIYLAPFKAKGTMYKKLILILWMPFNVPEKLRLYYETKFQLFKVLTKLPILLDIKASSVADLNLDAILKVALGKDYEGQGELGGNVMGEADGNVPNLKIDPMGLTAVGQLTRGLKRYCLFGLLNGQLVLDKAADFGASFDHMKVDLMNAERDGEPRYALFLAPVFVHGRREQKLMLITWVPLTIPNAKRLLYLRYLIKLKLALGIKPWLEFTALTLNDLQLPGLVKYGLQNNLIELSVGPLGMKVGQGVLNPFGIIGCLLGNGLNVAGGLAGNVLGLGNNIVNGVLGLGNNIVNTVLGGLFGRGGFVGGYSGGRVGFLGSLTGGMPRGGFLSGFLGGTCANCNTGYGGRQKIGFLFG